LAQLSSLLLSFANPGENDGMKKRPVVLSPDMLLAVPRLLWAGMLFSSLAMAVAGLLLASDRPGRGGGPLTLALLLPAVAGVFLQGWLSAQLGDRRLFPRILAAQDRLGLSDPGSALLYLRLNLQLITWVVSVLGVLLGDVSAVTAGPRSLTAGLWLGGVVTLLLTLPRRAESSAQLARWKTALEAKNLSSSMGCAGGSLD
jgi:hypothetical protein